MKGLVFLVLIAGASAQNDCDSVEIPDRVDCGFDGIDANGCLAQGCCWSPVSDEDEMNRGTPWCFYPDDYVPPTPGPTVSPSDCDDILLPDRIDCAFSGEDEAGCVAKGCCWSPVLDEPQGKDTPWCFFPEGVTLPPSPCDNITWSGEPDNGFDQAFYDILYENYKANLNVENCGAVCAAPDDATPGGSYYYHWMRDAGLSIKAWLDINDNDLSKVREELDAYVGWVDNVQHQPDPEVDVRVEPKFYIPTGQPYDGGWCRPQTDGPALRAMALSKYGELLLANGENVASLWSMIEFDLEWVLANWEDEGCDLWEEVRSDDFYWNRMAYVYSLNIAADFADKIGESGDQYRALADEIKPTAESHFNGDYIYESTNREQDGSVIHAIATFGEYLFPPESPETASTIARYANTFCEEYPINQDDVASGLPGILIGRYPGDSYAGGNPWQLLTAVLGETFYKGAIANYKNVISRGADFTLDPMEHKSWMDLLKLERGSTMKQMADAQVEAGDAVMARLYSYINGDAGRVDEQIDKYTGAQASAEGLTWSYANILHSLKEEQNAKMLRNKVQNI